MTWLWFVLVGWFAIAAAAALLLGGGIRVADRRDGINRANPELRPLCRPSSERLLVAQAGGHRAG